MSLKNIRDELATDYGYQLSKPQDRLFLLQRINKVARDLHNTTNLKWSCREQYFTLDSTQDVVSFPWHVSKFWGARYPQTALTVAAVDMRPRYAEAPWKNIINNWRVLTKSPLQRDLDDATKLWVHLKKVCATNVVVTITGKTEDAERASETVTIQAGSLVGESTNIFDGEVTGFGKLGYCESDVVLSQSDDATNTTAVISELKNFQEQAWFLKVQKGDFYVTPSANSLVEVCYKHEFVPFVEDSDNFVCTDCYDNAIQMIAGGSIMMKEKGQVDKGQAFIAQGFKLAMSISGGQEDGETKPISFPLAAGISIFERPYAQFPEVKMIP